MHAPFENITVKDLQNLMGDLRRMARGVLQTEGGPQSLTPTALANTALRRSKSSELDWETVRWENRRHFFSALHRAMRHALVDHARRGAAKGRDRIVYADWDENVWVDLAQSAESKPRLVLAVEEAMELLEKAQPRLAELLELHYYAGFTVDEIVAFEEGTNEKAVDRELKRARTALKVILSRLLTGD